MNDTSTLQQVIKEFGDKLGLTGRYYIILLFYYYFLLFVWFFWYDWHHYRHLHDYGLYDKISDEWLETGDVLTLLQRENVWPPSYPIITLHYLSCLFFYLLILFLADWPPFSLETSAHPRSLPDRRLRPLEHRGHAQRTHHRQLHGPPALRITFPKQLHDAR